MIKPELFKSLYSEEAIGGSFGFFGLDIKVASKLSQAWDSEAVQFATYDAVKLIKEAILAEIIRQDPEAQKRAVEEKKDLLACFPLRELCFVETIPNGYTDDYSTVLSPWFVVTTHIGRFKIGWRRSVIQLEWTETNGTKNAEELFKNEEVTKGGKMIHAWSYEDAKRYIATIIDSANNKI